VLILPDRCAVLTDPGAPPGEGPATPGGDVRAAGALFHWMLAGEPEGERGARLTPGAGYNRAAVRLWQQTRESPAPSAAQLLTDVRRLRASL
jgi:hypothetical protein